MATNPSPVEVGARGTIASLVYQEIEYFKSLELDHHKISTQEPKQAHKDANFTSGSSRNKPISTGYSPKKKKTVSSGGFLPRICSAVEIAETVKSGYRNLRTEGKELAQD